MPAFQEKCKRTYRYIGERLSMEFNSFLKKELYKLDVAVNTVFFTDQLPHVNLFPNKTK